METIPPKNEKDLANDIALLFDPSENLDAQEVFTIATSIQDGAALMRGRTGHMKPKHLKGIPPAILRTIFVLGSDQLAKSITAEGVRQHRMLLSS